MKGQTMKVTKEVKAYMAAMGRVGGSTCGPQKSRGGAAMQKASRKRWDAYYARKAKQEGGEHANGRDI